MSATVELELQIGEYQERRQFSPQLRNRRVERWRNKLGTVLSLSLSQMCTSMGCDGGKEPVTACEVWVWRWEEGIGIWMGGSVVSVGG